MVLKKKNIYNTSFRNSISEIIAVRKKSIFELEALIKRAAAGEISFLFGDSLGTPTLLNEGPVRKYDPVLRKGTELILTYGSLNPEPNDTTEQQIETWREISADLGRDLFRLQTFFQYSGNHNDPIVKFMQYVDKKVFEKINEAQDIQALQQFPSRHYAYVTSEEGDYIIGVVDRLRLKSNGVESLLSWGVNTKVRLPSTGNNPIEKPTSRISEEDSGYVTLSVDSLSVTFTTDFLTVTSNGFSELREPSIDIKEGQNLSEALENLLVYSTERV